MYLYCCLYFCTWRNISKGNIFRIVFGTRGKTPLKNQLEQIAQDLKDSNISVVLSENIAEDTFRKFVLISPYASCGAYFDIPAGIMQNKEKNKIYSLP